MKKEELIKKSRTVVNAAGLAELWKVKKVIAAGEYPWHDFTSGTRMAAFAAAFEIRSTDDSSKRRNVVVGARLVGADLDWGVWCGDHYLEGRNTATAPISFPEGVAKDATESFLEAVASREGLLSQQSLKCDFWEEQHCEHTDRLLAHISEHPEILDDLEELWLGFCPRLGKAAEVSLASWLEPRSHLFQLPVLLMGDRGAGKTYFSRALAEEVDAQFFELGFHAETKASTMLGKMVLNEEGRFAWVDGPLTRAFRLAKRGQRVLVLLDELLRAPQEQLSALLTALSPTRKGTYRLMTGRITGYDEDGVGIEEVLEAPVANIAVIATTNVGAEYAVCEIDPALQERFFVSKMDTNEATLRAVLVGACKRKGLPETLAEALIRFWKGMQAMVSNGQLPRAPTLRVLSRALERARNAADLKGSVLSENLQWVELDSDGQPVPEHIQAIEKTAKAAGL